MFSRLYGLVNTAFIQILNVQESAATVKTDEPFAVGRSAVVISSQSACAGRAWESEGAPGSFPPCGSF